MSKNSQETLTTHFFNRHLVLIMLIVFIPAGIYTVSAVSYIVKCQKTRLSCLEHRTAGCSISGEYTISTETPQGKKETAVSCDMETEKGGWTLVANYLHRMSAPGSAQVLPEAQFPLQNQAVLGLNEVSTSAWGHVGTGTLSGLKFKEMRFRCQSSAHSRLVDFAISSEKCLDYFRTGQGSCLTSPDDKIQLQQGSRALPGNGAQLLKVADKGWKDQGSFAMVNYPFFLDYKNHWSVGRLLGRFECDDYDSGSTTSTWHQIWVR